MEKAQIKEHLYTGHSTEVLLEHYKDITTNKKLRENNEEYIDMLADVIVEKIHGVLLSDL